MLVYVYTVYDIWYIGGDSESTHSVNLPFFRWQRKLFLSKKRSHEWIVASKTLWADEKNKSMGLRMPPPHHLFSHSLLHLAENVVTEDGSA